MRSYVEIVKALESEGSLQLVSFTDGPYRGRKFIISDQVRELTETQTPLADDSVLADLLDDLANGGESWLELDDWNKRKEGHEAFIEYLQDKPRLFLLGGGHVGLAFADVIRSLDFHLIVMDERPEFANKDRFPSAHEVVVGNFEESLAAYPERNNDWFVIMTPGHKKDKECAFAALQRKSAYVGMIGSKTKVARTRKDLLEAGISQERLDEFYSPIGLNLGGQTPAEIAISIAAEIVQIRNQTKISAIEDPILEAIHELDNEPVMMVTIIKKTGSGPREPGTRMLVDAEGKLIAGTIGGGALELDALKHAKRLFDEGINFDLQRYDLTDSETARLGMICGGNNEVIFERF